MPHTINRISETDRVLFCRCRTLNTEIAYALQNQIPPHQADALRQLLKQEIPPDARKRVQAMIAREERESARLAILQAEFDCVSVEAENAAEQIENQNLRRFIKLFCIDALPLSMVCAQSGFCVRTAERYRALLNQPAVQGESNGQSHQTGAKR